MENNQEQLRQEQLRLEEVFENPIYDTELSLYIKNELVRTKKDNLSVFQAKLLRFVISQILLDHNELLAYEIEVSKLAEIVGLNRDKIYERAYQELNDLIRKGITIREVDTKKKRPNYIIFSWLSYARYYNGVIKIQLNPQLKGYLVGLGELFTNYQIGDLKYLDTDNAIKMYELLKSFANKEFKPRMFEDSYYGIKIEKDEIVFPLEYLKEYFNCSDKYKDYKDFIKYVIKKNIEKINVNTVMRVSYRTKTIKNDNGTKNIYIIFRYLTATEYYSTIGKGKTLIADIERIILD